MKKSAKYTGIIAGLIVAVSLLLTGSPAKAQYDRPLNFLPIVPQGRNVNPGFIPDYNFYIGVPFLSSVKVGFENSINYEDIFLRKGDSLILDRDHILDKIDERSNLNINFMEELFTLGLRARKNYFHIRIADIVQANMVINSNLMRFLLYGNGSNEFIGKNVNIGDNTINATYYREYALGYTRQINQKLNFGVSLKYLQGIANAYTEKAEIDLMTDPEDFTLTMRSDIDVSISAPGIDDSDVEVSQFLPNANNPGFAIDFGAQYKVNNKIEVFASVLNIGSITWKENVKNFRSDNPDEPFVYEGFDINEYFEDNQFDEDRIENIVDSIVDEIGINETAESYSSRLAPMLNAGGRYFLTDKDVFNLLIRNQFVENGNWFNVSLAYTRKFSKDINLMVSNSFFKHSFLNPGVGFAANLGPLQLYLTSENIIAPFMLNNSNVFVVRFGVNLVFGKGGTGIQISPGETEQIDQQPAEAE